jgi:hypothetical protein
VHLDWFVEPVIVRFSHLFRFDELQVKMPQQLRYDFVQFAERDLFAVRDQAIGALPVSILTFLPMQVLASPPN